LRIPAAQFFSSRGGGLVGSDENLILDCYRLARFYHTSPDAFLGMPLGDVQLHLYRTIQLTRIMQREAEAAEENG
jgi:hypothetical protein